MSRKYGNGQTIGSNVHQNTYFMVKQQGNCLFAVLADGTVDSVTGAYGAILTCETIIKGFALEGEAAGQLEKQFACAAYALNERIYKGRPPRISALAACFKPGGVTYRRVGELYISGFKGKDYTISEPEAGTLKLQDGPVLLCNQGVFQALNEIEIEKLLLIKGHPYKKAQCMIEAINKRNLKDQKSAVLVIVK